MKFREFHKSIAHNKSEEACDIGDVVLIHEDNTPRINLRMGIIDSFMPPRDGIKKIVIVRYAANGQTDIRRPMNKLYHIEHSQRKNDDVQSKFIDERNIITNI